MASPKFSPTAFSPASDTIPPVTSSSSNSSAASPSPTHNTNQTSSPPTSSPSATPPQSSPPSIAALPPSPSQSLSPQSPPPSAPTLRPPPPSSLPPPPSSPPTLFRPPPPSSPSPSTPPPLPPSVPPTINSPPPPATSLSPPTGSIPPKSSPVPPAATSPPPPPPRLTHPPQSNSTPTTQAPENPISPSSPPSIPSSSSSTPVSSPTTPGNFPASGTPTASPLPVLPTEKPTANPTATDANDKAVTTSSKTGGTGGVNTGAAVAIGTVIGFIALGLIIMAVLFVQKRKKRALRLNVGNAINSPFASQNSDTSFLKPHHSAIRFRSSSGSDFIYSPSEPGEVGNSRSWFSYEELAEATDSFSAHNLLGKGGFGCVYKGCLEDGREVAVKQLNIDGGQGEREFRAEVETISRVHHRHLVSLVGYCISEHERLLVYEYVPNNTLHHHLHGEDRPILNWATRAKIAAGAARGIAYLHEDCHPRIIHRDIKSSNILLDENFEARVSDFGLAKLALDAYTHITTRVMGTFGYLAPEYASSGKLTEKSDVYSFGVVLLELITGREPVDATQPVGEESLVEWARPLLTQALDTENFEDLVDPRLEKNYVASEMFRMVEAAAACVRHSAVKRPRMGQVVRALGSVDEFPDLTNGMKLGQSAIYDSREQSARIRMFHRMAFGSQEFSSDLYNDQSKSSWRS